MKVKIETEEFGGNIKYQLLTSDNGYHWSGGGYMSLEDLEDLKDFLDGYVSGKKATQED